MSFGIRDYDPALDPPPEMACRNCGEEVIPGSRCECGAVAPDERELQEEAEEAAAEDRWEAMRAGDDCGCGGDWNCCDW